MNALSVKETLPLTGCRREGSPEQPPFRQANQPALRVGPSKVGDGDRDFAPKYLPLLLQEFPEVPGQGRRVA